jgi:hypothetical protein
VDIERSLKKIPLMLNRIFAVMTHRGLDLLDRLDSLAERNTRRQIERKGDRRSYSGVVSKLVVPHPIGSWVSCLVCTSAAIEYAEELRRVVTTI